MSPEFIPLTCPSLPLPANLCPPLAQATVIVVWIYGSIALAIITLVIICTHPPPPRTNSTGAGDLLCPCCALVPTQDKALAEHGWFCFRTPPEERTRCVLFVSGEFCSACCLAPGHSFSLLFWAPFCKYTVFLYHPTVLRTWGVPRWGLLRIVLQ